MPNNVDLRETAKFDELAHRWWDPDGEFKTLHAINPIRLDYVDRHVRLQGKQVLDVGCGGGILAEGMATRGARVTGIDMAAGALTVARLHALESGVQVEYRAMTAEALAQEAPASFDAVTCMELLEHVPDPVSTVRACARLVRPGGHVLFSTINRNPKAYLLTVVAAEYLLRWLPRGTHEYGRFIRPAELGRWIRAAGLELREFSGLSYRPLTGRFRLSRDVDVNYLASARRPDDET